MIFTFCIQKYLLRETKEVGLGDVERGYQNLTYLANT